MGAISKPLEHFSNREMAGRHGSPEPRPPEQLQFLFRSGQETLIGGILANGAGMLKYGENGKGIKSRWYPETLKRRILDIIDIRERIEFIESDGIQVMRQHADRADMVFFIDPPYTAGNKKLGADCIHIPS